MVKTSFFLFACLTLSFISGFSQQENIRAEIEQALTAKNYRRSDSLLQVRLNHFFSSLLLDSFPAYIAYIGKVEEKKSDAQTATRKLNLFIERLKTHAPSTALLSKVYSEAAEYYGSIGLNERAYKTNQHAYTLAQHSPGILPETLASIDSDMGTFAFRMGNVSLAQFHHRKAISVFLSSGRPDYESLYTAANNMGSQMWLASKMDSSIYYFNIALAALAKTQKTPINQYYRPAVLQNNMSALYNMQGQTKKAIDAMKACIENLRIYLSISESVPKKANAISFQFEATDNLGGIYKELGDYKQAFDLEYYSYQQKQKNAGDDPSGVFKSQILLGQLYLAMKEHDKAMSFLTTGLKNISGADGDFLFWQADACSSLALLYEEKGDKNFATQFYERADSLYEASLEGEYDDIYLEFLRNASLFYAGNKQLPIAVAKANKGFDYVKKTQGTETLLAFYQLLNLSEVYLKAGQYQKSLDYSKQSLAVVEKRIKASSHQLDSVKTELKKPQAILVKTTAEYHLLETKTPENLAALLKQLDHAVNIIERRKTIIHDSKDISVLMAGYMEILNFIKRITHDLYTITRDQRYVERLMDLQESGTYTRIRSRLDKSDSIRFVHVPYEIQEREKHLKAAISSALERSSSHSKSMAGYFTAVDQWNAFQTSLKKQYPHYYKMRYEAIFRSLGDVQQSVPLNTTVIRYFFIDKDLFAVVLDRKHKHLLALRPSGLERHIKVVTDYTMSIDATTDALYQLYHGLWAPLTPHIRNSKMIIIPDGMLYNLNFEILTPVRVNSYEQLASTSLLSKYTISYHYTLALIGRTNPPTGVDGNFIAFAPGFMDAEKQRYLSSVKDSFPLDQSYATLLPQPFTLDLVRKAKNMLGGTAYINSASTASSFRTNAGRHKIIHIGTHAESNNLSPEFSRLIFSKSTTNESNSVFLHELYNCDLRSELAVLTACESGKPGYQDGEGMISLAHAFNYAGSESILTGLWKIDEKASTLLMEAFYKNLLEGMDKDEALRRAKLHYLNTSKGRMLAPQYWAGLVLMGDTSSIDIKKRNFFIWWIGGIVLVLASIAFVFYKRRKVSLRR